MKGYLSVSEYAKLKGKDPGNIRRLLANGRLKGEKLGNQWVILEDAEYPSDQREKTGKYRNWRKRKILNENHVLKNCLTGLVSDLRLIYGDLLKSIVIYGSYARGTQGDESDVDIALILSGKPSAELTDAMLEKTALCELECEKVLSVIEINSDRFNQWKKSLPFYRNIWKEGLTLWKAT